MTTHFIWSANMLAKLRAMWAEDASQRAIGEALGVTGQCIGKKAAALGLPPRGLEARGNSAVVKIPTTAPAIRQDDAFTAPPGDFTIDLADLRPRGDCRWPYGERPPYQFCARPAVGAYCQAHSTLAYAGTWRPSVGSSLKCERVHA